MAARRILIVEDEEMVRDLWAEALEDSGYSVVTAGTGGQALACLPDVMPDLILLDITMPEMTGLELLARLRANPRWAGIPVLVVSALGEALSHAVDAHEARRLGIGGILPKPVEVATLLERVARLIAGHPAAREPDQTGR